MLILPKKIKLRNTTYKIPNPMQSYEEYLKYCNQDLRSLTTWSYGGEMKAKAALVHCDPEEIFVNARGEVVSVQNWLLQRIIAIRKEKARRQNG
jgi:hypothetical protein